MHMWLAVGAALVAQVPPATKTCPNGATILLAEECPAPAFIDPFIVFFDVDSSAISPTAATILDNAVAAWRLSTGLSVMLYGHTDRLGAASDNLALSRRRANSVRAGLIHRGIPEGLITTEASGETRPLVETEDGAREPQNRRVEISFGPGPAPSAGQPHYAPPVSIVASVGHSERCRAGTVRLDLSTGRYTLRAPATWRTCRKAGFRAAVSTGVVAPGDLAAVRAAWRRADVESLEDPTCGRRNGMQRVVIGNGGSVILRVTRRTGTVVPPGNLGCWSEAALNLHQVLRRLFDPPPSR